MEIDLICVMPGKRPFRMTRYVCKIALTSIIVAAGSVMLELEFASDFGSKEIIDTGTT